MKNNSIEEISKLLYGNKPKEKKVDFKLNELLFELKDFLTPAQMLYPNKLELMKQRYFLYQNKTQKEKREYIKKLILRHANNVGKIQAIKDLQRGLSILNKNRRNSPIEAKNILKEDGIIGPKTKASLDDICQNYSLNIIKKYILKGIMNNIIFETKNNKNINTERKLEETIKELRRY